MIQNNVKLNCFVEQEDDSVFIFINLVDDTMFNMTLQFADITKEFRDFEKINEHYLLYEYVDDLITDLENAHLQRFMGQPRDNDKLDLIVNLRMKMKHQSGNCDNACILCNPDIGDDPFPDFTFNIRNMEPEGEA